MRDKTVIQAVSAFKILFPKEINWQFSFFAISISFCEKPPSGPIKKIEFVFKIKSS